ncbi:endolytic transglycosylase MltG [Actinomyces naeslundii]|uniref:Endolytic murein transglycosylase n=2 Tax=Actinomyces naeslundii TaxID=1655 RepID=J3F3C1_ACTNH|nr:endolytic transglycosylase MltG [Actinomyces naeslundii]EJN85012.1 YceG family protein [Actinomyces naeslundii str. Howell 279]OLO87944.1 aminodeoxychorismate lyase [Actinomyces naeslundii]OMG22944.1 aminodeoxychorismate lyase [Actinomyces naeslundii]OMG29217.1 aminodeoxychorismate lyase [Actinomyces naeslundii]OMG38528.1 aminodeoxychorismate lyase [Actinomyces naeslundii]
MSHDDFFAELGIQRDEDAGDAKDKPKSRKQLRMEKVERRQRKRRRHWLTSLVIVITLAAVGVLGYKAIGIMRDASAQATHAEDYKGNGEGEVTVTIPEGASGLDIGDILQEKGVVASGKAFTNAVKNNPKGNTIQPGTYKLKKKMSANAALQALLDPETKGDHTLTVSAGHTKQIVKDRLKQVGNFSDEQIDAAFADTAGIGLPAEAGGNVEGWLAPGTYDVTEKATPKDLVKQMVSRTVTQLKDLKVPKEDYHAVLTKASIIEREVNDSRYYGQVARVIENRLAQTSGETHGLLQMDSTVQYGLGRFGGIPNSTELADSNNAYNTYVHQGLPPGPIGSPSEEAIKAVLNPPAGSWLYFVTVNLETGETLFSSTSEEQKANTKKLDEYCKKNEEICNGGKKKSG